jgi:GT2 family glycosyltransferase
MDETKLASVLRHNDVPTVLIIVLNWNGKQDTVECLESLSHISYPNYEVIVVDNGSTDGSVEQFKARYPEIKVIENQENLGFAEGNNVGIRAALQEDTEYVLLLNNDTIVDPRFLDELANVAELDPRVGFAGPKIYWSEDNGRGRKDIINCAGAKLSMWTGRVWQVGVNEIDHGQYDKVRLVDYVTGACLLVKTKVVTEIGLLDSNFFTYWEEVDWCWRGYNAGYTSIYAPKAKIWHKYAASSGGTPSVYYGTRNRFWFMRKNALKRQYLTFLLRFFLYEFWLKCQEFLRLKDFDSMKTFCKAVFDGLVQRG